MGAGDYNMIDTIRWYCGVLILMIGKLVCDTAQSLDDIDETSNCLLAIPVVLLLLVGLGICLFGRFITGYQMKYPKRKQYLETIFS